MKQYKLAPDFDIEDLERFDFFISELGCYTRPQNHGYIILNNGKNFVYTDTFITRYATDIELQDLIKENAVVEVECE